MSASQALGAGSIHRGTFHSFRDVMIKIRQFVNGWSEPLSPPHKDQVERTMLADQVLYKIKTRLDPLNPH